MYRDKLDPEVSSWDEVVSGAEHAETIVNLANDDSDVESAKDNDSAAKNRSKRRSGGRVETKQETEIMRTSSAGLNSNPTMSQSEKTRSIRRRNEMLAKGLCFNCEEHGHLARNCPKLTTMTSKRKDKPPGFGIHTVHFEASPEYDALAESTEVLDTLPVGAAAFFDAGMAVEEGEGIRKLNFESIPVEFHPTCVNAAVSQEADDEIDLESSQLDPANTNLNDLNLDELAASNQSLVGPTVTYRASSTDHLEGE
jgi:hypothetical protein